MQGFSKKSVSDRFKFVKESNLCVNCLQKGYFSSFCHSSKCRKCHKPHSTLLHFEKTQSVSESAVSNEVITTDTEIISNCSITKNNSVALLCTAMVTVNDKFNKRHTGRALLDSGSQSNFITKSFANKLGLKKHITNSSISGINQSISRINNCTTINMNSNINTFTTELSCLILNKITNNLPQHSFDATKIKIPENIILADKNFNESREIDILLGSDIFWNVLLDGNKKLKDNAMTLQNTKLGWIISGSIPLSNQNHTLVSHLSIEEQLQNYWQIEHFDKNDKPLSNDEQTCEKLFKETSKRDICGQFVVSIPLKENIRNLGDSKNMALRRFFTLENRLEKQPDVKEMYTEFMREYETLNHMIEDNGDSNEIEYYLPHHHVIREESLTTKLRVVFDASAKTITNTSLNDIQYSGSEVQSDLFSILIKFRRHQFIAIADIEKMYQQIWINPGQQNLQKIIWRERRTDKFKTFNLLTVTYGTKSAPYLATRCLQEIALLNEKSQPVSSQIIKNEMYVDDLLTGADSEQELVINCTEVSNLLQTAGFSLRKWKTNSKALKTSLNLETDNQILNLNTTNNEAKTLGILLNTDSDEFLVTYQSNFSNNWTKRLVVSLTAQTFDPLGFLTPATITPKLIIQQLWKDKIDWDAKIPTHIERNWLRYIKNISEINKIKVKRHILKHDYKYVELHGFADASEKAYGACIYIKSVDNDNNSQISLLTSKSRVAPLKTITLPRLELCAATLLAQLVHRVKSLLNININKEYLWSDSTITLCWIHGESSRWKAFVSHRVSEIQRITKTENWYHVKSSDNPADLISRGILPENLKLCNFWWYGPQWLSSSNYPIKNISIPLELLETKPQTNVHISTVDFNLFRFSKLPKLVRTFAYCLRFINKCKKQKVPHNSITTAEYFTSLNALIEIAQIQCFANEKNN